MPNSLRHVIGLLVGLAALPAVYYGLGIGTSRLMGRLGSDTLPEVTARYAVMVAGAGIVVAVLTGWQRLSPLAPLLTGAPLSLVGALWGIDPKGFALEIVRIDPHATAYAGASGLYLFIGLVVLLAALPPSRWRSRHKPLPGQSFGRTQGSEAIGSTAESRMP